MKFYGHRTFKAGVIITTAFGIAACADRGLNGLRPPKPWQPVYKHGDSWGRKVISLEAYEKIKIGDAAKSIDETAPAQGIACYACFAGRNGYQACFMIKNGVVAEKSIRKTLFCY